MLRLFLETIVGMNSIGLTVAIFPAGEVSLAQWLLPVCIVWVLQSCCLFSLHVFGQGSDNNSDYYEKTATTACSDDYDDKAATNNCSHPTKITITTTNKHNPLQLILFHWTLLYSAIFCSWADYISHVILNEWLHVSFHNAFFVLFCLVLFVVIFFLFSRTLKNKGPKWLEGWKPLCHPQPELHHLPSRPPSGPLRCRDEMIMSTEHPCDNCSVSAILLEENVTHVLSYLWRHQRPAQFD